ncbi:hypothetical protein [Mesorhizobium sp. M0488]|uniref:hypothetical protein n=1 Tax=unclassified Mesorhizobium TaxID=325217 RepID=UPI0033373FAE
MRDKQNDPKTQGRKIPPLFAQEGRKDGEAAELGTFDTREAAEKHEREVQYFKGR